MQKPQKAVYEEIEDDQHEQHAETSKHQTRKLSQQRVQNNAPQYLSNSQMHEQYEKEENHQEEHEQKQQQQKSLKQPQIVDQQDLGQYVNLEQDNEDGQNIKISIGRSQKKGGVMSSYFVYIIQGTDSKGSFSIARRFNEFYQMRVAMVARWPGCFVPSIPAKNALSKNDTAIIKKRTRYLNDFVKKMAKLPHLYFGEEFQTLLRSEQTDISETFSKWPAPTSQSIINKYKSNFSALAGKELNLQTNQKIKVFSEVIRKNQSQLSKERLSIKHLAESNDRLINSYANLFTNVLPTYEKQCFSLYCNNRQADMLYLNETEVKLQQHQTIVKEATNINPFWLLYDMIRHEERDAMAFSEVFQTRLKYEQKKHSLQIKIIQNQKNVAQLSMGKKPFSTFKSKGTNEQIKYRIQQEIEQLKKQKQSILIIIDIISAMIAYIEIQRYKSQKKRFYVHALARIGSSQIISVQNLAQIWHGLLEATENKLSKNY